MVFWLAPSLCLVVRDIVPMTPFIDNLSDGATICTAAE
jgi:hypothetical protein